MYCDHAYPDLWAPQGQEITGLPEGWLDSIQLRNVS
jgi:hypothetical protein